MEIILIQLLLSLFGFGLQASSYVDAHTPAANNGGVPCNYELNDVPNNLTLHIDGYEIAYPIRSEISGAAGLNPTINSNPPLNPPQSPFTKGEVAKWEEGQPRYYILAEPILFRRAGDLEWQSFFDRGRFDPSPPNPPLEGEEFKIGD